MQEQSTHENTDSKGASSTGAPTPIPAESLPVTLTVKAVDMVATTRDQEGIDSDFGLRIAVRGGGCSGFEYALDFEGDVRDTDLVYDQNGLRVIIDPISARYLRGTEIDYVFGMQGAGFKFNNPNAIGTCGCGSSFTV